MLSDGVDVALPMFIKVLMVPNALTTRLGFLAARTLRSLVWVGDQLFYLA